MAVCGRFWFSAGFVILGTSPSWGQDIGACHQALVMSTYQRNDSHLLDWRLASAVSYTEYDEVKREAGGSAVIYGVPAAANYGDFKKNIRSASSARNEQLSSNEATNILWTGLDRNSQSVYSKCVDAVTNSGGLSLIVLGATESDITLQVRWRPRSINGYAEPSRIAVTWQGIAAASSTLPSVIDQGDGIPLVLPRPPVESTLALKSGGTGAYVVLTPLPIPIPPVSRPVPAMISFSAAESEC